MVADEAVGFHRTPALVDDRGGVEDAGLGDRAVHGDEILVIDAEVGTERAVLGIGEAFAGEIAVCLVEEVGPFAGGADAAFVPALHGAAGAGPFVGLAGPLVIALGHFIEHARANRWQVGTIPAGFEQMVGHGGKAEAGAGTFLALVEDAGLELEETVEGAGGRDFDEGWNIHLVPEIDRVAAGGENATVE